MEYKPNDLMYEDQSYIKQKVDNLHLLMYRISSKTRIHHFFSCILYFIEDVQLLYFVFFDKSVISLNETIRYGFKLMGLDDVNFNIYYYSHFILNILYLIGVAIIFIYLFFIPVEKFKENYLIKYLRFFTIFFNIVIFPYFCHGFAKTFIPKGGKLAGFSDVDFIQGNALLFILSVVSFIFFIFLQLLVFPFIYVNPTPFNKLNSLCQTFGYVGLKYNVAIIVLSFLTVILKAYTNYSKIIFILLLFIMLILSSELMTSQPYYNKYINYFRSGMWCMIIGTSIINLFSLCLGSDKSFFSIFSLVFGIITFFVGFFLSKFKHNKHIEVIYKRFKEKKIEDKNIYKLEHGIEGSSTDSHSKLTHESSGSDNDENSEESSDEVSDNKKDESENSDEEESDYDNGSDVNSVVISDRVSERITSFSQMNEIMRQNILNEPVKVYRNLYEFELACRFIRNNETKEAFQLMKELYEESLKQFSSNSYPYLYTLYAYYLLYIDQRMTKSEKDEIIGVKNNNMEDEMDNDSEINSGYNSSYDDDSDSSSDNNNSNDDDEVQNYKRDKFVNNEIIEEDDVNKNNPDYLLSKALTSKTSSMLLYFVKYMVLDVKDMKKEDKEYNKRDALDYMVKLQHEAVEKHITILNLLRIFFNYLKYVNNSKSNNNHNDDTFDMDKFLLKAHSLKKETLSIYQNLISEYPDEKSTYQLYALFLTDVVNQAEGEKFMLNEADSFMALDENNAQTPEKSNLKKRNSVSSFGVSNTGGSSFGDPEKKRKMFKNNMIHTFTDKCKMYSKLILGMFSLITIIYVASVIYGFIHITGYSQSVRNIQVLSEMNYNIHNIISRTRMSTSSMALGHLSILQSNLPAIENYIEIIETQYIPILKKYVYEQGSDHPIIIYDPNNQGQARSEYVNLNGYELAKNIIVWAKGLFSVSPEEWIERSNMGENILLDYRFRMFAENFKYYYYDVVEESMKLLYEDEIATKNRKVYILYGFTGALVILSITLNLLGITPLYNNTRRLYSKTLGIFRYLLRGSLNEIISRFEVSMESITETYDIGFDPKKSKYNIENQSSASRFFKKFKGYIINFFLIVSVLCLTVPIIIKDGSIVKSVNYNMQAGKRKDILIFISIFAYEVLVHDEYVYAPGMAEAYLNYEIEKMEKLQDDLYLGKLGMPPTRDMKYLNSLIVDHVCKMDGDFCDHLEDTDIAYDYVEEITKIGLNELIEEFLDKMKVIVKSSRIENIKNEQFMYYNDHNFIFKAIAAYTCPEFLFELNIMQHILAGLEKFDNIVYNNIYDSIRTSTVVLLVITVCGVVVIVSASIMTYRTVIETNEELNELVDIIFIIPPATINMIPQFKRFIETSSFDVE